MDGCAGETILSFLDSSDTVSNAGDWISPLAHSSAQWTAQQILAITKAETKPNGQIV